MTILIWSSSWSFSADIMVPITFSTMIERSVMKGEVDIGSLALVILVSAPNALVEGYGIFQAIRRLSKNLTMRGLAAIYLVFFLAVVVEVGFVQLLLLISTKLLIHASCLGKKLLLNYTSQFRLNQL